MGTGSGHCGSGWWILSWLPLLAFSLTLEFKSTEVVAGRTDGAMWQMADSPLTSCVTT